MKRLLRFTKENWIVVLLIVIGVAARMIYIGAVPGGINQDEAFAGYEANSLLYYGMDSSGYHLPVYFVSWGSGMNVLNSYLMIPFIAMFGLKTWVIRLPQVLAGCASLPVFYLLLNKIFGKRTALIGLFIFAICPWHIMMSRWGLESNLAPAFLLFGLYFFILGVENSKLMIFSALFYGLGLYTYATIWPVTAAIILLSAGYCWYVKKLHADKFYIISCSILIVFAFPLALFLMVNNGLLSEIKTPCISIPKLVYYRGNELSITNILNNLKKLFGVAVEQSDGLLWNETKEFGLYYKYSFPLILLGYIQLARTAFSEVKSRTYHREMFVLIQLAAAVLLGCLIPVNVNRVNCIHIPNLICLALGISFLNEKFKNKIIFIAVLVYSISFILFAQYYVNSYNDYISVDFQKGLEDAVDFAMRFDNAQIYITGSISYPKVLFYSKLPVDEYVRTVKYTNYPSAFLKVSSCGNLHFGIDISALDPSDVYVINNNDSKIFEKSSYTLVHFDQFAVAYMKHKDN